MAFAYLQALLAMVTVGPLVPAEIHTDGHHIAPRKETTRLYGCGIISASIRYRTERFDIPEGRDDRERRVTLLGIALNGQELPPAQLAASADLFRRFGEIEALGSNCVGRFLEIRVFGTTHQELADYARTGEQPDNELWTIRLSENGVMFVR